MALFAYLLHVDYVWVLAPFVVLVVFSLIIFACAVSWIEHCLLADISDPTQSPFKSEPYSSIAFRCYYSSLRSEAGAARHEHGHQCQNDAHARRRGGC